MGTINERSHANIVANFERLLSFCIAYGNNYHPSQSTLSVASLQTLLQQAQEALNNCVNQETIYNNAVDARRDVFKNIRPLATQVVNCLATSGVSDNVIDGAKSILRKMRGGRATPIDEPMPADTTDVTASKHHSVSQQGYQSMTAHFGKLIELVESHEAYQPFESPLKVPQLKAYLNNLQASNTLVISTYTAWNMSRLARTQVLYEQPDSLVNVAHRIKAYIKAAFGFKSLQYQQISGIYLRK